MIDKEFDMANFEQSLRDHADEFSIVPSGRAWQGIYNDLHPGKRWPSVAMLFLFLFSFLGLGYLNNTPLNYAQNDKDIEQSSGPKSDAPKAGHLSNHLSGNQLTIASLNKDFDENRTGNITEKIILETTKPIVARHLELENHSLSASDLKLLSTSGLTESSSEGYGATENETANNATESTVNAGLTESLNNEAKNESESTHKKNNNQLKNLLKKQKKSKFSFAYFFTPTVSSVYFNGNPAEDYKSQNLLVTVQPRQSGMTMILNAQLGLKAGGQLGFQINDKWRIISEGQVSFSGYSILSNHSLASINDIALQEKRGPVYSQSYFTTYGNGKSENQVPLKNYSLQFSLPVGVEYQIWESKNVQIDVASTVGPSFVLKGNAFLLSSDGKNYINDNSLLRKTNYTGTISTNISFSSNNVKWQVGPIISYQLLSTYENKYPVKEHLVDYGIRIAISK